MEIAASLALFLISEWFFLAFLAQTNFARDQGSNAINNACCMPEATAALIGA
jgi:hypothetical protein